MGRGEDAFRGRGKENKLHPGRLRGEVVRCVCVCVCEFTFPHVKLMFT